MSELETLQQIRTVWIDRFVLTLGRAASIRPDLRSEAERLFNLLEQAVQTGDPAWLDSVLSSWATALISFENNDQNPGLTHFLNEVMQLTVTVCQESLDSDQSQLLLAVLLPVFGYGFDRAVFLEIDARIAGLSSQLEDTRQSLEKLDRSKSNFIAVAAHELKTPLTLIEGYASMLSDSARRENPNSPDIQLVEGINSGARRLQMIIDDMIDASLIDNDLLSLNFQPVWINRLLAVLKSSFEESISTRNLKLEILDFPGSTQMTYGDPERLIQAFRHLLTNAIKFTPDGGSITVDGRKLPGFIEATISDTGIGIAPENLTLIFEKFYSLGETSLHSSGKTKFKGGGPGLGLSIAKGIIEAHGGAIWVDSPGYDETACPGSTFHVLLPQRDQTPDDHMAYLFASFTQPRTTLTE